MRRDVETRNKKQETGRMRRTPTTAHQKSRRKCREKSRRSVTVPREKGKTGKRGTIQITNEIFHYQQKLTFLSLDQ
jgi:hypothetical protein